uniref:CapO n=1 Tax=Capnodium sp. TTI-000886 TaxID=3078996 RepID=A0AA96MKA1_9PEZI|nr:CapO [Capnodium sp. TTI-000886]
MSTAAAVADEESATFPGSRSDKGTGPLAKDPPVKPSRFKLTILLTAGLLSGIVQDNTIITTAIPRITDEFNSLNDISWYGSGYLRTSKVTTCAFQLSYGKLYNLFPIKWVFLTALGIFELGSLVCGATPNSVGLIMGRVVAGIGSGGIFLGAILAIAASTPLETRPIFNGLLGAMYAVASIAGPFYERMGGAFTDRVTWRLCFYINLPFGLVTAICVFFFVSVEDGRKPGFSLPLKEKAKQFDFLGLLFFIGFIVSILLALQWGGSTYNWGNSRIIALFVLAGVLFMAFVAVQILQQDRGTVPLSVIKERTVWACSLYVFFLFGSFLVVIYYMPIWLQAIKEDSAVQSGIDILPSILATVIFSIAGGVLVSVFGYYTWTCIFSSIFAAVGAGLLSTFSPDSSSGYWIGYQIIYGAACGLTTLPEEQVAGGTAVIVFFENFGGAIFLSVAQNVFDNQLVQNIVAKKVPINPATLLSEGATRIADIVDPQYLGPLKIAYNDSVTQTFYVAVATAGISLVGSALIPWLSVKKKNGPESEARAGEDTGTIHEMTPSTMAA